MRHNNKLRLVVVGSSVVVAMVATMIGFIGNAKPALACPSISSHLPTCLTPIWPYGHSWYITNVGSGQMKALADKDTAWENNTCATNGAITDFFTLLDFGRPGTDPYSGPYYGAYALYSSFVGAWMPDSAVEQYAEQYLAEWYGASTACTRLHLVIGTGNDYECQGSASGCSVFTAGQQFDILVHDVGSYVASKGWAWQETVWGGEDIEAEWDQWSCNCTPSTVDFINGFTSEENTYTSHIFLQDYGDANIDQYDFSGHKWTQQNIYDAAWGLGWDEPLPEIYWTTLGTPGNINQWVSVYNSTSVSKYAGNMQFTGNIAECSEADTLPMYTCWTGNNRCEFSPEDGYNTLAADVGQSTMPYATNIFYQNAKTTGNNGCS